ncbi:hypothetical protein EYF80_010696 [Liparis tanakae]|uniref:Uncharacterized protein n=1 Tax=Liparis tanakae TaxID=230148 RepID=A0A4Z2IMM0_9TELE|nr:hypothetical protein EYF80_010696 [Liparis tanakae]
MPDACSTEPQISGSQSGAPGPLKGRRINLRGQKLKPDGLPGMRERRSEYDNFNITGYHDPREAAICLGGEARRPGPDPTDWHGLVTGGREGRREEHGKEGAERRGKRMKERAEQEPAGTSRNQQEAAETSRNQQKPAGTSRNQLATQATSESTPDARNPRSQRSR